MVLIESVPNISEGRRADVIAALVESVQRVPGVRLLDHSSDASHNRSVFTLVGDARGLEIAMRANPATYGLAAFRGSIYAGSAAGPVNLPAAWLVTIAFAATAFALAVAVARR